MTVDFNHFTPKKNYLVCVDSDGCAMDTMDCKHYQCFGPCMVAEWALEPWQDEVLKRWNEINLYTMTRGINRFKGLALALTEIDQKYTAIEGVEELAQWAANAPELSNRAVQLAAATASGPCLAKAFAWSQKVNAAITALPAGLKKPFAHVKEGLLAAHSFADVAVVSSANREAVREEWARCGLLDAVDVLCCQDAGSKAQCIAQLQKKGYAPDHILMVGDAPGDLSAAEENGVYFFPILVKHEGESWSELQAHGFDAFVNNRYSEYGAQKRLEFLTNLNR